MPGTSTAEPTKATGGCRSSASPRADGTSPRRSDEPSKIRSRSISSIPSTTMTSPPSPGYGPSSKTHKALAEAIRSALIAALPRRHETDQRLSPPSWVGAHFSTVTTAQFSSVIDAGTSRPASRVRGSNQHEGVSPIGRPSHPRTTPERGAGHVGVSPVRPELAHDHEVYRYSVAARVFSPV